MTAMSLGLVTWLSQATNPSLAPHAAFNLHATKTCCLQCRRLLLASANIAKVRCRSLPLVFPSLPSKLADASCLQCRRGHSPAHFPSRLCGAGSGAGGACPGRTPGSGCAAHPQAWHGQHPDTALQAAAEPYPGHRCGSGSQFSHPHWRPAVCGICSIGAAMDGCRTPFQQIPVKGSLYAACMGALVAMPRTQQQLMRHVHAACAGLRPP